MVGDYTKHTTTKAETRVGIHNAICGLGNKSTLVEIGM